MCSGVSKSGSPALNEMTGAPLARKIEGTESQIRARIAEGMRLGEARAALGYHTLQRKS